MGHMLPPDDDRDYNPGDKVQESSQLSSVKFFMAVVTLMFIVLTAILVKQYIDNRASNKSNETSQYEEDTSGGSLGGAMGGGDDKMPTPESITREINGGGMKVMISSPSGDRVIEVSPEQMKRAISKPIGGDATEAIPVGGAGRGK